MSWIGFDWDGSLVKYDGTLGDGDPEPVAKSLDYVKQAISRGLDVRIFTARVAATGRKTPEGQDDTEFAEAQRRQIEAWCMKHLGRTLPVTATKDFEMLMCFDDRAVQLVANTGLTVLEVAEQQVLQRFGIRVVFAPDGQIVWARKTVAGV